MDHPNRRQRLLILGTCCLSLLIVGMDATIVNVALPSIRTSFSASISDLQWVIDAYTVVLASLLILSGSTADRFGRRRTFQAGLVLFTIGSATCSLAPSLGFLVIARMIQAVGGSMLNPVALSIITNVFTEPKERAKAIGVWGAVVGISLGIGPVLGGILIESAGWRSIFWVNIPIGMAALILTTVFVPESRAVRARQFDPAGQVMVIVLLAGLTYWLVESGRQGWGSARLLAVLALAVVALVGLLVYEPRRNDPLIELRFFSSATFSGATVIAVCAFGAFAGLLFLSSLYLQEVRGFSPLKAGLTLMPMAAMTVIFAPLSARLVAAGLARVSLMVSGTAMAAGAICLTRVTTGTSLVVLIGCYMLFAIGFGLVNAPITYAAVSSMPRSQAGVAAAVASTSRQIGSTLGVAVIGSVLAGGGRASSILAGSVTAWWIVAGSGLAVLVVGAVSTGRWAQSTARRTAALLGDARTA